MKIFHFVVSDENDDDFEGIILFGVNCFRAMQRYVPYLKKKD